MAKKKESPVATIRTEETAAAIVEGLTNGIPLRELCRKHEISKSEVYRWMDEDELFKGRIARAREKGYEEIFEECLAIADDSTNDWMDRRRGDDVDRVVDAETIQRSKIRIETRLKLLSKWDPKKYGEKLQLGGASDLPPLAGLTDEAIDNRIKALLSAKSE